MTENRTETNTSLKGGALIEALIAKAGAMVIDKYTLAEKVGITYPYLCAISNGRRPVDGVREDKLRLMAEFLGLTFVQVLMLAGKVSPSDFLRDQGAELERAMVKALDNMRSHHEWGGVAPLPEEWAQLSQKTKIGIALMWQQVSGQNLQIGRASCWGRV